MTEFKVLLPQVDGLLLRPHLRKRAKLSLQTKDSGTSSIPQPQKRGRKRQDHTYRNRVGQRAQNLRKVCTVGVHVYVQVLDIYINTHTHTHT